MSGNEEIPLMPIGREQIHKLESALLIASIFSPRVLEELENPRERLTWIDSLAVAAAALAREKAKMSIPQIAEELGRTEATIRNHLQGKTKAGQIVRETYESFLREGVRIQLPTELFREKYARLGEGAETEKISQLQSELESLKARISEYESKLSEYQSRISEYESKLRSYESRISHAKQVLASLIEAITRLSSEL
ncbi:MAG: transcriptional regulator [Nitrososphaerota archaeon]